MTLKIGVEMKLWLIHALLSAICAAFVSIFGKIGLENLDANAATATRAIIMAIFLSGVVIFQGNFSSVEEIFSNGRAIIFFGEKVKLIHGVGIFLIALGGLIIAAF